MSIGNCDCCFKENVYLRDGYDSFGVYIVDCCYFGCGDERNDPTLSKEKIDLFHVEQINQEHEYGSEWLVKVRLQDEVCQINLIRRRTEKIVDLVNDIMECWSIGYIEKELNVYEYRGELIQKRKNDLGYRDRLYSIEFFFMPEAYFVDNLEKAKIIIDEYYSDDHDENFDKIHG